MRLPELPNHDLHDSEHGAAHGESAEKPFGDVEQGGSSGSSVSRFLDRFGSLVLLGVVIAVSAALLYGMRKLGTTGKLDLVNIKIDYPVDGFAQKSAEDHRAIIEELLHGHMVSQVPIDGIQMNPFHWHWMAPSSGGGPVVDEAARLAELKRRAEEEKRRQVETALRRIRLNSVIGGQRPAAYISGNRYEVGDTVNDLFVVKSIQGRSVVLTHEGQEFVLTIGE